MNGSKMTKNKVFKVSSLIPIPMYCECSPSSKTLDLSILRNASKSLLERFCRGKLVTSWLRPHMTQHN
jgi:hypothetical protein